MKNIFNLKTLLVLEISIIRLNIRDRIFLTFDVAEREYWEALSHGHGNVERSRHRVREKAKKGDDKMNPSSAPEAIVRKGNRRVKGRT